MFVSPSHQHHCCTAFFLASRAPQASLGHATSWATLELQGGGQCRSQPNTRKRFHKTASDSTGLPHPWCSPVACSYSAAGAPAPSAGWSSHAACCASTPARGQTARQPAPAASRGPCRAAPGRTAGGMVAAACARAPPRPTEPRLRLLMEQVSTAWCTTDNLVCPVSAPALEHACALDACWCACCGGNDEVCCTGMLLSGVSSMAPCFGTLQASVWSCTHPLQVANLCACPARAPGPARGERERPTAGYLQPPQEILDVVDHPPEPNLSFSPDRRRVLQLYRPPPMPPISELARPEVKLAGAPPAAAPRPRRSRAAFLVADASLGQGRLSHAQPEDLP